MTLTSLPGLVSLFQLDRTLNLFGEKQGGQVRLWGEGKRDAVDQKDAGVDMRGEDDARRRTSVMTMVGGNVNSSSPLGPCRIKRWGNEVRLCSR